MRCRSNPCGSQHEVAEKLNEAVAQAEVAATASSSATRTRPPVQQKRVG